MTEKINAVKAALAAAVAAGTALWGWYGWLALTWVACMALDYVSGSAAAMRRGDWSSARAREGLWHKAGMILAVVVSVLGDLLIGLLLRGGGFHLPFGGVLLAPLVTAWYCLTELGSVAENALLLGAPVPKWLRKLLRRGVEAVDEAGEAVCGKDDGGRTQFAPADARQADGGAGEGGGDV